MKRLRIILPVLLILALATLACGLDLSKLSGGKEPTPKATEVAGGKAEPTATKVEAPEAPTPTAAEAEAEATATPAEAGEEEADIDLVGSMSGMKNLNSYRVAFRFDWKGTKGGEPVTGYMEMRSAFVREPPAQELHFEGQGLQAGEDKGLGKVSFIQVGDTAWFYESESNTWMQVPAGQLDFSEGMFFKPEDLLKNFNASKGQRSLLPQEVNGVQCYKYTFNEKDFATSALAEGEAVERAQGEVYVAVDGGYVVKLAIDADLSYSQPTETEMFDKGNVKMTFDLSDINQPITIEPPAEAKAQAGGREDIPMLSDAKVEFSSAEFVSYKTASSVKDAAQFYEDEMPKKGWTAGENNKDMIMDESAILSYTKEGETASIIIGSDEKEKGTTNVMISITKEQQ